MPSPRACRPPHHSTRDTPRHAGNDTARLAGNASAVRSQALAAASPLPAAPGEELPLLGRLLAMSAARVEAFAR